MVVIMKFQICWWNTGLSPPVGKVNDTVHLEKVRDGISALIDSGVNMIFLGEVNSNALNTLAPNGSFGDYIFIDRSRDAVKTKFNMALGFRADQVQITDSNFITQRARSKKRKLAQLFSVILNEKDRFEIFVVHWPSRIYQPEDGNLRSLISGILRTSVDAILDKNENEKIVLLGDFNDEPHNESIALNMSATRDPALARRDPRLLYNPFWRSMVPVEKYCHSSDMPATFGTYYYHDGDVHKWQVLDQALVSSAFLGRSEWHLNENETTIVQDAEHFDVGPGASKMIDHLPIVVTLEKIS